MNPIDRAVLCIAGAVAIARDRKLLAGLSIEPENNGRRVVLRLNGHTMRADVPRGVNWWDALIDCEWLNRQPEPEDSRAAVRRSLDFLVGRV
jgi:hypothetical protein